MIVGERSETIEEKTIRHYEEINSELDGWKRELNYARNERNSEYEDFCILMIEICENTVLHLKEFATKRFITL